MPVKSDPVKLNFYFHSRGSLYETKSHLLYARDVRYLTAEASAALLQDLDAILLQLNAVIATIRHRLAAGRMEDSGERIEK